MELDALQFVVRADGRPTAVQIDIETWHKIVETLEDAEDVSLAREALAELEAAGGDPYKAGWLRLEDSIGRD
jgi:predicted DNA-binding protein